MHAVVRSLGMENTAAVISEMIARREQAMRGRDASAMVADYAPDAVKFDLAPPLQNVGVEAVALQAWMDGFEGTLEYEVTDLVCGSEPHGLKTLPRREQNGHDSDQECPPCPEPEASYQSTRTSIPQCGRAPVSARAFTLRPHQVGKMSCDTRRSASDILRYASPGTLIITSCAHAGSKDAYSSFVVVESARFSCHFSCGPFGRPVCVRRF